VSENTKIQWADHTFNPWMGCTKVAEGCKHCYAEDLMDTRYGKVAWGPNGTRVRTSSANWAKVRTWNRRAAEKGVVETVFCASLADVFEDWDGSVDNSTGQSLEATMNDVRRDLFALIDECPNLRFLLLTKRPGNIRRMWPDRTGKFCDVDVCDRAAPDGVICADGECDMENGVRPAYRPNVALIYSASTQADLEAGIGDLLACRDLVPTLGLSLEPLVGPVNITRIREVGGLAEPCVDGLDWVIVGGESGHGARPCNVEWIRDIVRQCRDAGVPCFVKQLGSRPEKTDDRVTLMDGKSVGVPCSVRLSDPKGGDPSEWPEDLRVRQYPWEAKEVAS